jgi:hypothetical protein
VELDVLGDLASKNTTDGINLRKRLQRMLDLADQLRPFNEYEFETTDAYLSGSMNYSSADVAGASGFDQPIVNPDSGQGRVSDILKRKAIEDHAMVNAYLYYRSEGYEVEDTSATKPYDLVCSKCDEVIRVEVKGTQMGPDAINQTKGEVDHAYAYDGRVDLFIMYDIGVTASNGRDGYECLGGVAAIIADWSPDARDLVATQYKYNVPNTQLQLLRIH